MNRILLLLLIGVATACSPGTKTRQLATTDPKTIINSNIEGKGPEIFLEFYKGESFYYPLMAVWLEDLSGNYIQTL